MRFSKETMNSAAKTIRKSIKKNNTLPAFVTMKEMDTGKKKEIPQKKYAGLFENENVFRLAHGRQPNYVTYKNTANNPLVFKHQSWSHSCCCASLSMASMMLYNYKSESKCCKELETKKTTTGTPPSNLMNYIDRLGMKATIIPRNKESVSNNLKLVRPVLAHIDSCEAKCLNYDENPNRNFGHWITIYGVSGNYYKIADPLRGLKQCRTTMLDKAMLNRKINYYAISLK